MMLQRDALQIAGTIVVLAGTVASIRGCVNYAIGKGCHGALGLLGLLSLCGLVILLVLPDKEP